MSQTTLNTLQAILSSDRANEFLTAPEFESWRERFHQDQDAAPVLEAALLALDAQSEDDPTDDPSDDLAQLAAMFTAPTPAPPAPAKQKRKSGRSAAKQPAKPASQPAATPPEPTPPAPRTYTYRVATYSSKTAGNIVAGKPKSPTVHTLALEQLDTTNPDSPIIINRLMLGRNQAAIIASLPPDQLARLQSLTQRAQ